MWSNLNLAEKDFDADALKEFQCRSFIRKNGKKADYTCTIAER